MAAYKKDPNATLDYVFDWAAYLTPINDTIVSVEWVAEAPLVLVSTTRTFTTATAWVSGGVADTTLALTCRITTVSGRIDDRTISLKITNR